jgi:hypothetical protein
MQLLFHADLSVALGLGFNDVCIQNFPLPSLKYELRKLCIEVHHGRGFCVIRGLDPQLHSPSDSLIMFLGLTSYIAERRGRQDQNGNKLGMSSKIYQWTHTQFI